MLTIILRILQGILELWNHHVDATIQELENMKGQDENTDREVEDAKNKISAMGDSVGDTLDAIKRLQSRQASR